MTQNDQPDKQPSGRRALGEKMQKNDEALGWFETLYKNADFEVSGVPWEGKAPGYKLQERLDVHFPKDGQKTRQLKAVDVGTGLGQMAQYMSAQGLDVTAFDLSETAIRWATERFSGSGVEYVQADLLSLPASFGGAFDLVHETYTLQSLPPDMVALAIPPIASLLAPGGLAIVMCRARDDGQIAEGPPWPMARAQLQGFTAAGLEEVHFEDFYCRGAVPIRHFLFEYRKPFA